MCSNHCYSSLCNFRCVTKSILSIGPELTSDLIGRELGTDRVAVVMGANIASDVRYSIGSSSLFSANTTHHLAFHALIPVWIVACHLTVIYIHSSFLTPCLSFMHMYRSQKATSWTRQWPAPIRSTHAPWLASFIAIRSAPRSQQTSPVSSYAVP